MKICKHHNLPMDPVCPTCREAALLSLGGLDRALAASLMGSAKSAKKTAAARENGKKGGAPKKLKVQHLPSDYPKDYGLDLSDVAEMISEQEARWGEPLSTNE